MTSRSVYLHVPLIGRKDLPGLEYMPDRPARHCRICGTSYQPSLARCDEYESDQEVQWAVEILLQEWAVNHNKRHSQKEHSQLRQTGKFLTPEATVKLAPLGIYPVQDMVTNDEVAHAARIAPRAPIDDVEGS
jgi:hypothetical protein